MMAECAGTLRIGLESIEAAIIRTLIVQEACMAYSFIAVVLEILNGYSAHDYIEPAFDEEVQPSSGLL